MKYHVITILLISLLNISNILPMDDTNQKYPKIIEKNIKTTPPFSPPRVRPNDLVCPGAPRKKKLQEVTDSTTPPTTKLFRSQKKLIF